MKIRFGLKTIVRDLSVSLIMAALLIAPVYGQQTATAPNSTTLSATEREAESKLNVDTIRTITSDLAKTDMEGRGTGLLGGQKAAKYLADYFAKLGLQPLGDNKTFLQAIQFTGTTVMPDSSLKAGNASLKFGEDYVLAPPLPDKKVDFKAPLVFITYGVVSPDLKRDDLANLDLKGKIVVLISGQPKNVDQAAWQKAANPQATLGNLLSKGISGLIITNVGSAQQPFSLISNYLTRRQVSVANAIRPNIPPRLLVSDAGAEKLFAGSGMTYAQAKEKAEAGETVSRDLGQTLSGTLNIKTDEGTGSNVVGVLEG